MSAPAVRASRASKSGDKAAKPDSEILFQTYFKSVGPRTYAAQVKRAGNGNHFLVLTEGKRDDKTDEVRKTRLFVFSEDFPALFRMLQETAQFIKANPVPDEIKKKRDRFWAKQKSDNQKSVPEPAVRANTSAGPVAKRAEPVAARGAHN